MRRMNSFALKLACMLYHFIVQASPYALFHSEEMSEEVQAKMESIQDGEMSQFKDLGRLLEVELKFADAWAETLRDLKEDWPQE